MEERNNAPPPRISVHPQATLPIGFARKAEATASDPMPISQYGRASRVIVERNHTQLLYSAASATSAKRRAAKMAAHRGQPIRVDSSPATNPVVPVMTPVERSNSPPIMSKATAIAIMPNVEAGSRIRDTPVSEIQFSDATMAKKIHTTTAPMRAPISTRRKSPLTNPTRATRSSALETAVVVPVVISTPPCTLAPP